MSFLLTAQKSARLPRETIPSYVFRFCALVERQRFTNPPEGPPTLQYKARGMSVWIVMHTFTLLSTVAWSNVSGKCACPSVLCRCLSYSCIRSALSGVCTHLLHSEVLEDFSGKCLPYASAHRFRRTTAVQYFLELAPPPPPLNHRTPPHSKATGTLKVVVNSDCEDQFHCYSLSKVHIIYDLYHTNTILSILLSLFYHLHRNRINQNIERKTRNWTNSCHTTVRYLKLVQWKRFDTVYPGETARLPGGMMTSN